MRAKTPPTPKAETTAATRLLEGEGCARPGFLCLLLALATLAVFLPVARHGYVNYDDSDYVYGERARPGRAEVGECRSGPSRPATPATGIR